MSPRIDAIWALLVSPFIAVCCIAIAVAVAYVAWAERPRPNPYDAWARAGRAPGELPEVRR